MIELLEYSYHAFVVSTLFDHRFITPRYGIGSRGISHQLTPQSLSDWISKYLIEIPWKYYLIRKLQCLFNAHQCMHRWVILSMDL